MGNKRRDLGAFAAWLHETRGCSAKTVNTYVSVTRRMLTAQGFYASNTFDPTALAQFVAALPAANRTIYRTAWRAFVRFAAANTLEVPNPFGEAEAPRNEGALPDVPNVVLAAVRQFTRRKLTLAEVLTLRWDAVGPPTEIPPLGVFHSVFVGPGTPDVLIPAATITTLREWGQPDPSAPGPLLPRAPGASEPLAEWALGRLMARSGRPNRWDA